MYFVFFHCVLLLLLLIWYHLAWSGSQPSTINILQLSVADLYNGIVVAFLTYYVLVGW
jgi:hypothetical protein